MTAFCLISCGYNTEQIAVIWTDRIEFAVYAELFNVISDDSKVVVVYKENPAQSFSQINDINTPDIIIGNWLANKNMQKYFMPLDYMFDDHLVSRTQFYSQLLQSGRTDDKQYLLPVSFNLGAVIFSIDNSHMIEENYMLSPNQIRDIASSFNTEKDGIYTSMGFAPSWQPEFLYDLAKLNGADFSQNIASPNRFDWDSQALDDTVAYIRDWTSSVNTSSTAESDYQFKYLSGSLLKNIENNSLFAYVPSNVLFTVPTEKAENIDFRWIQQDDMLVMQDEVISMGLYKKSKNNIAAEEFIIWFMNEQNQDAMLHWQEDMNLYTKTFGISNGFSSIRSVNERIFPLMYPALWGNVPPAEFIESSNLLLPTWPTIKASTVLPYLLDAVHTSHEDIPSLTKGN